MNCFNWVAMSCTIYMVNYNFATHAICPLALKVYKYNELQMPYATQKLSCKANCKTPFFFIVIINHATIIILQP